MIVCGCLVCAELVSVVWRLVHVFVNVCVVVVVVEVIVGVFC